MQSAQAEGDRSVRTGVARHMGREDLGARDDEEGMEKVARQVDRRKVWVWAQV